MERVNKMMFICITILAAAIFMIGCTAQNGTADPAQNTKPSGNESPETKAPGPTTPGTTTP
ncbi:MAG: hypothetical protein J6J41_06285, partial [Clostridia bacterium]|nr:hypothetical protein [Clostridia bacterium]